jgi:L-amino acid N-acyltransferase YncA
VQVYILSKHRAKGLAKLMLSFVITQLIKEFSCLTYIVSEKNLSSIKLAESLGFKKKIDLADVQILG